MSVLTVNGDRKYGYLSASHWKSDPKQFFPKFHLCPDHRDNMEVNTYPAVDLPVYGEADGAQ